MSAPVDVLAVVELAPEHQRVLREYARDTGSFRVSNKGAAALAAACVAALTVAEARAAVAELIDSAKRVQMIPSPVGTGYQDGTPEDAAYIKGFMYALRLVREPGFACGLDAALARVRGEA